MGKIAKVALPIAAIAGVGLATGGFSLAAGAGAAGTSAVGAGAFSGGGMMGASKGLLTASAGGFSGGSMFGATSLFTKANMGLALKGISAVSSIMGGNTQNQLAQMQMAQLQDQKNIRQIQILQEQNELRERHQRWQSTVRATGRDDPNIRRFLSSGRDTLEREMRNIGITGRGDINAFNSQIRQTALTGRTAQYSGFIKAGRSLLTGVMDYNKTRGAA